MKLRSAKIEAARNTFEAADDVWRRAVATVGPGSSQKCVDAYRLRAEALDVLIDVAFAEGYGEGHKDMAGPK